MLKELLAKWDRHLLTLWGVSKRTTAAYRPKIRELFAWLESQKRSTDVKEISRKDIEDFLAYLFFKRVNTNPTRASKLVAIRRFWQFLKYEKLVPVDVTVDIPRPRVPRKFVQDFTRDEILSFFAQVDIWSEKGLRDASILILMAFGGLRVGELCKLRLQDIRDDGERIEILLPEDIVKQHSSRVVELWKAPSVFVRELFHTRLNTHGAGGSSPLIVSYRNGGHVVGNPLSGKDVDRLVKKMGQKAGIRKARIHSHMFRASFGAGLRNIAGYDIVAISTAMGHANISTTDKYLPRRGRVGKQYRSLRDYWIDFERIWTRENQSGKNE